MAELTREQANLLEAGIGSPKVLLDIYDGTIGGLDGIIRGNNQQKSGTME